MIWIFCIIACQSEVIFPPGLLAFPPSGDPAFLLLNLELGTWNLELFFLSAGPAVLQPRPAKRGQSFLLPPHRTVPLFAVRPSGSSNFEP